MAAAGAQLGIYEIPDDGNEEFCGACRRDGVLICCENCPAAYHFGCAGYAGEDDVPGGEEDAWLCWGCSQKSKTPFLHSIKPLDLALGDDVRVASKEGSIEYHKASVVGGNITTMDVVYEDLTGVRESIDRRSRRLWRGTLNDDGWEKRGIKYVPISRAYTIDIDRILGSPAGRQPTKPEACSATTAAAVWQNVETSSRLEADSWPAQAKGKDVVPQPAAKAAVKQKMAGKQKVDGKQKAAQSGSSWPSSAGGSGAPAAPPAGLGGPGLPALSSAQHARRSASPPEGMSQATTASGAAVMPKRPRSALSSQRGTPLAGGHPPMATAAPPARPPLSWTPPPPTTILQPSTVAPARPPLSWTPPPPTTILQPRTVAPARPPLSCTPPPPTTFLQPSTVAPTQRPSPAVFRDSSKAPRQPLPTAASAMDMPWLLPAAKANGNTPSQLPPRQQQQLSLHARVDAQAPPLTTAAKSANDMQRLLQAADANGKTPQPPQLLPQSQPALHASVEARAFVPPVLPAVQAPTSCERGTAGLRVPMISPADAAEMDVEDMQRPFLDPKSLAALAEASEWDHSMVLGSPPSQGAVAEEMKAEQGSPAEAAGAPTPTQAATPEMSTAGADEDTDSGEPAFTAALQSYLDSRDKDFYQPRIQQKPVSAYQLWKLVAKAGGSEKVTNGKGWARIARAVGAPDSMTDKSTVTRKIFQLSLGDFEEAVRRGEVELVLPQPEAPTATPPPRSRQRNRGGRSSPTRKRQRASGRASGRAAERRVVGWVQVNKEHALDVGASVEVRSHDKQHTGGWLKARILQVCPGSLWEGGLRFEVELEDDKTSAGGKQQEDSQPPASGMAGQENGDGDARLEAADGKGEAAGEKGQAAGKEREWVPLVHAPANGEWPAVLIRQPLQPAAPPTPPTEWRVGERVEGYWAEGGSWWPATLKGILPDGDELELRVDPTPAYRDGELWVLPADQVRRGHSAEREGFGLLEPLQMRVVCDTPHASATNSPAEEQWTTFGDLRRKLAWQQHTVDGWAIEAYATQAAIPQTPNDAEGSPASRLHTTNRQKPAPDPLASLEEAAARVLGRTLSAATPRAATAAAGLLDLAPSGRRGRPFARGDPDTPSVGSAGGGSGEGAYLDTASGDDFEGGTGGARAHKKKRSRLALPPLVDTGELSCDEALDDRASSEDDLQAQQHAGAGQPPSRQGKGKKMGGVGLKGKRWAPPPRPRPRWECPAVSVPGSLDGFFGQGTPSAIVDPDYSARLEASGETLSLGDGKTTPTGKSPVKAAPAAKATAAAKGPPAATAPPATESAPAAKGAPASRGVPASEGTQRGIKRERAPAGIKRERVPGPAQPASAPAKVYHWPVKRPRLGDEATSRGNPDSRPASAAEPGRTHSIDTSALKSAHRPTPNSLLPKWGQGSSRTHLPKPVAISRHVPRPGVGSGGGGYADQASRMATLQNASSTFVMGRPIGVASSLPGVQLSGLPPSEQVKRVLAHLRQSAASRQPAAAPVVSHAAPYIIVPLPTEAPAGHQAPQRRLSALTAPRPAPAPAPIGQPLQALRSGRHGGPASAAPAALPPSLINAPAPGRQPAQPAPSRVLGQVVAPASSMPGMYSQPAVAMRSLMTSASELLGRAAAAADRPMPALVSMPVGSLCPSPPTLLPHTSLSNLDIQRAAESIAHYGTPAAVDALPLLPPRPMQQPRAPHGAGLTGFQTSAGEEPGSTRGMPASAASMEARYPRIMPLGPPPERARYPKIQFSLALPPPAYLPPAPAIAPPSQPPHANGAGAPAAAAGARPGSAAGGEPRQPPGGSSRLVAALSQSLPLGGGDRVELPPPRAAPSQTDPGQRSK